MKTLTRDETTHGEQYVRLSDAQREIDILTSQLAVVRADRELWVRRADKTWHEAHIRDAERERCAQLCEQEICACCWGDEAQAAAEHLAAEIRKGPNVDG